MFFRRHEPAHIAATESLARSRNPIRRAFGERMLACDHVAPCRSAACAACERDLANAVDTCVISAGKSLSSGSTGIPPFVTIVKQCTAVNLADEIAETADAAHKNLVSVSSRSILAVTAKTKRTRSISHDWFVAAIVIPVEGRARFSGTEAGPIDGFPIFGSVAALARYRSSCKPPQRLSPDQLMLADALDRCGYPARFAVLGDQRCQKRLKLALTELSF